MTSRRFSRFKGRIQAVAILAIASTLMSDGATVASLPQDLEGYLEQALEANPGLQAFSARYDAARQGIPQASALPDPVLQVTRFIESVQTRTGPQETVIQLSQRIPWFGKLDSREAVAAAEAEALSYAYQNQQLVLARRVAIAYFEYGYTGQAISLTREQQALLQKLIPIVEDRVRGGGDLNPLLLLQVELGKVTDRLQSLEQIRTSQSADLQALLALADPGLLPMPGLAVPPVEQLDGAQLRAGLEAANPELAMLDHRIRSAEARRRLARLESYPDFNLGVNYIQIGDPRVNPTTPDAGADPWGVTLSVNIPLWQKRNRAAVAGALSSQRSAEMEYQNRRNYLRAELTGSLSRLEDANRRLRLYGSELLGLANQAVEISRTSYENGRTGILEVIDSERSLLELQLLYWRAAADAWQQRIAIQTLANQPLFSGAANPSSQ